MGDGGGSEAPSENYPGKLAREKKEGWCSQPHSSKTAVLSVLVYFLLMGRNPLFYLLCLGQKYNILGLIFS